MARNRILCIEDEENVRGMLRLTLETAGYEVEEAGDGLMGLEAFGDGSRWDAVLLDERMPGIDGLETLRRIRARAPGARVIMVTALASVRLAVEAMKLGATDFLCKPTTPEVLRDAVTLALSKPAPSGGRTRGRRGVDEVTANGFLISRVPEGPAGLRDPSERRFVVGRPGREGSDVVVLIAGEAESYVERLAHRRPPLDSSFWTSVAEHFLSIFLLNEGKVPPTGRLTLKAVSADEVELAADWDDEE